MIGRVVITGANSSVGRALLAYALSPRGGEVEVVAAVRSERAAAQLPAIPETRGCVARITYDEPATFDAALEGATALVHLPGLLVERPGSSYEAANVETTEAAVAAAERCGLSRFVLVSATGADASASNRYYRTKGLAEQAVLGSGLACAVLRAPLVLGPDTEGGRALRRETAGGTAWVLAGGRTIHQPLDVDDLAAAVLGAVSKSDLHPSGPLEVAGPTRLSYRELIERAAELLGRPVRVRAIPVGPVRLALGLRTLLLGPGLSPDALEVLLTDTAVDARAAADALGIQLTPLGDTIRRTLCLTETA